MKTKKRIIAVGFNRRIKYKSERGFSQKYAVCDNLICTQDDFSLILRWDNCSTFYKKPLIGAAEISASKR